MAEWEQIVTDGFPVPVTGSGAQRGAFGSLLVESLRPRTGWTFSYNTLNTRLVTATTTGTGAERDQHYCKRISADSRGMVKWPTGQ